MMFAILLGNMFAPIMDYGVKAFQERRTGKGAAQEGAA
jgi:Na+-translocating ferredoxin:NAD+ oxidoreductase RnfD subunit